MYTFPFNLKLKRSYFQCLGNPATEPHFRSGRGRGGGKDTSQSKHCYSGVCKIDLVEVQASEIKPFLTGILRGIVIISTE